MGPQQVSSPDPGRRVSRLTWAFLATGVAVVLAAGSWGLTAPRGDEQHQHLVAVGESLEVPGGILRVDKARDTSLGHVMPGMDFAGQQEPGKRRFAVTVTLRATGGHDVVADPGGFLLDGAGVSALGPFENDLGTDLVPAGSELTFTLVYQIPERAQRLVMVVPGAGERVTLATGGSASRAGQHGH